MSAITELHASNMMRLNAVELKLDGSGLVIVGGNNAQGKSSLLDSIMVAFLGGRSIPKDPVHHGADKGYVRIVTDEGLVIERTVNPDRTHKLTVKDSKGGQYKGPQQMLDALTKGIAFDPLEFARAEPKEQQQMLEQLIGIQTGELDRQRLAYYEERRDVGRDRDKVKAKYERMRYDPDAPKEPLSSVDLLNELREAQDWNAKIKKAEERIPEIEAEIAELQNKLDAFRAWAAREPKETLAIEQQLTKIDDINRAVAMNAEFSEVALEMNGLTDRYEWLDREIAAIDMLKRQKLADANLGIEGLDFGEDGVMYGGVPLSQASQAERVRVSVALAMAVNPEIKVMLIREGALLDEKNMAMVAQMAVDRGYQVWIERVGHGDECQIVIEDGRVLEDRRGVDDPKSYAERVEGR